MSIVASGGYGFIRASCLASFARKNELASRIMISSARETARRSVGRVLLSGSAKLNPRGARLVPSVIAGPRVSAATDLASRRENPADASAPLPRLRTGANAARQRSRESTAIDESLHAYQDNRTPERH